MAKGKGGFIGQDGLNAPDAPTGVSGTAGDTQVTVSWTAPSDVGGSAITGYNVQAADGSGTYRPPFDISAASYDSKSFDVSSQDTLSLGLAFSADGTKMYMCGANADAIFQYSLSTAWDVSTASYDSISLSVSSQDTVPRGILLNADGTSIYVCGDINAAIFQYDMTTAYDLSTASYASKSLSVSSEEPGPAGIAFNNDGTKIYVIGYNNDNVRQYALSTAYDVSTGSYESKTLDVSSQDSSPRSLFFNSDGTKLFVNGNATDTMYQYSLSSAYDVSTGSYDNVSFLYSAQADDANAVTFKPDGSKMYICNFGSGQVVYQYSTQVTDYPTASPVTITGLTNGTSYTFNVWAINAFGWSSPSDASDGVSPAAPLGVFARGYTGSYTNTIDYVTMSSAGNATDWGDATSTNGNGSGTANATRGLFASSQAIDYITFSSTGNAADFGDMQDSSNGARCPTSGSNSTRGLLPRENATTYNQLQYVTFATTGNATNFGNLSVTRINTAGFSSPTRAVYAGGSSDGGSSYINNIDYVTTATTGNATDFGDQTEARGENGGASSSTRGLVLGGKKNGSYPNYWSNVIDYVTIASTGNATDFGDLTQSASGQAGASSNVKAIRAGGEGQAGTFNNIDEVTIATTGNATDFGDLTLARYNIDGGLSNAHGGLQ